MSNQIAIALKKEIERVKKEYGSMENYKAEMRLRQVGQTTGEDD